MKLECRMSNVECRTPKGSVLILVMILTAVLLMVSGSALSLLTHEYSNSVRSTVWNESLFTAEAGLELAYNALNRQSGNTNAWTGWTPSTTSATNHSITSNLYANGTNSENAGSFTVSCTKVTNDWIIVALGTTIAPHSSVTNVSRQVEIRLTPGSPFAFGLLAKGNIDFQGNNVFVDSYNSEDTANFPGGQYAILNSVPVNHANENGDVGTNGTQLNAGNADVFGDLHVGVNGEILTGPNVYVSGSQDDGLQVDIPDATGPGITTASSSSWTPSGAAMDSITGWPTTSGSQTSISGATTLSPGDYNISSISMSGNAAQQLILDARTGDIRLYISGNVSISGNASIQILGTNTTAHTVQIWVVGNVDVGGNGLISPTSNVPGQLKIFAKTPATPGQYDINLHGNANFKGAIYAPGHDFIVGGAGNTGTVYGSVVANTITMGGNANFHYDEALGTAYNASANWEVVYWRETTPP